MCRAAAGRRFEYSECKYNSTHNEGLKRKCAASQRQRNEAEDVEQLRQHRFFTVFYDRRRPALASVAYRRREQGRGFARSASRETAAARAQAVGGSGRVRLRSELNCRQTAMSGPMTDAFGRRRYFNQDRMCKGCRRNTESEPGATESPFIIICNSIRVCGCGLY